MEPPITTPPLGPTTRSATASGVPRWLFSLPATSPPPPNYYRDLQSPSAPSTPFLPDIWPVTRQAGCTNWKLLSQRAVDGKTGLNGQCKHSKHPTSCGSKTMGRQSHCGAKAVARLSVARLAVGRLAVGRFSVGRFAAANLRERIKVTSGGFELVISKTSRRRYPTEL